ncbi:nuclease-related domain-containing protein [Neobacillus sp. NPDC097160]|uniref:nuclease-related domain-containing protein n=1 Tax=Neobacillus sp. NPDC097160 TaxID=3364298 RepID=UPI00382107CA
MKELLMKDLPIPQRLILTEILKKYLKRGHPIHSEIDKDLAKRWAGYWGERALANYVKELPQEKYLIFHDLELQLNGIHFQIDTLLICQNFILIIEAKNISGTLYFDNVFNQLIRINPDGTEESFEDPRVQCQRLQSLLRRWLVKNGLHLLPIDHLVFFKSANKTILKSNPNIRADFSKVCKGRDLFNKIEDCERRYKQVKIDPEKMYEIGKLILSQHSPKKINILETYGLMEKDIPNGVMCPNSTCSKIPMEYKKGKWICPKCHTLSKNGHIEALLVHFLLIKPTITNMECQNLLQLPSRDISQKFLLSLNLPSTGHTKNRLY